MAGPDATQNNASSFETFLAVAIANYTSDKDEVLSFKVGQEILITGEALGEAGNIWWLGKLNLADDELFVHKPSVVRKRPFVDPSKDEDMKTESSELKELLVSANLDANKWLKILDEEEIKSVRDLEDVFVQEGDNCDIFKNSSMKQAEKIKFQRIRDTAAEKAEIRKWVSNVGLSSEFWTIVFGSFGIKSIIDFGRVASHDGKKILQKARTRDEELIVERLLKLNFGYIKEGQVMECLKGCGMKIQFEAMGEHNCLRALRQELFRLSEDIKIKEIAPVLNWKFHAHQVLTLDDFELNPDTARANHWLCADGYTGPGFVYELPMLVQVTGVSLKNTTRPNSAPAHDHDRATNGYTLHASSTGSSTFRKIISGSLPDIPKGKFKDAPVIHVPLDVKATAIRFDVDSYYRKGPGLHYFRVHWKLAKKK